MRKARSAILILLVALCLSACLGKPVYKNDEAGVRFKYGKDMAWKADDSKKQEGYELYIGFAQKDRPVSDDQGAYPIEFVVIPEMKESDYVNGGKYISGFKKGDKFYYFSTYKMERYGKTVDKMAKSLEFLN